MSANGQSASAEDALDDASSALTPEEEQYLSIEQRRLARFALRFTVPSALVTALIFSTLFYWIFIWIHGSDISWYNPSGVSFIELYVPSAFIMPIMQSPVILRRTLRARVDGRIEPPLPGLDDVDWMRWGVGLGVIAGGVWATVVVAIAAILASWWPSLAFGEWFGLIFRILLTVAIALSVAILCALVSVLIKPTARDSATAPVESWGGQDRMRGRPEVPTGKPRTLQLDRWRTGVAQEILKRTEASVYFSGAQQIAFIRRFFILLTLSVLLVVLGLDTDSAPVVIAAMLIAPLMTPIFGLTLALVTGRPKRQVEALALIASATGFTFVLTWIVGLVIPTEQALRSEVLLDYTDPRFSDLLIALIAGAIGMYILVHTEASTALPGVAIGISLEPPLATAGLMMADGREDLVIGAFLMFLVNLAAIVACGSLVLVLSGFLPISAGGQMPRRVRIGLISAGLAISVLAYPLYRVSSDIWNESSDEAVVADVVDAWAAGTDLRLTDVTIDDDAVRIVVTGSDDPPSVDTLAAEVSDALDRDISVNVQYYAYTEYRTEAEP